MLMEEEAKYGRDLVQGELELVASEWDAPHRHEECKYCRLDGFGDWVYCKRSRHHVDHVRHQCSVTQECECGWLS